MKTILKLSLTLALLLCVTAVNGQKDSTLYKVKLMKFENQVKNSRIATYSGLVVTIGGGISVLIGRSYLKKHDDLMDEGKPEEAEKYIHPERYSYIIGGALLSAGTITSVISGINWGVGKRKIKEYQIRLDDTKSGFYYNPKSIGVTLAFKF
ncbi:MAG: hypothetical protein MUF36_09875 [Bacteroidales bacterium]|jgi:hypothetical protein|nr:hypothetical protein [Bacteroidales bacterium]